MEVHSDDSPAPLTEKHPPLVEESALSATTQDAESKPSWDFFIVVGSLFFGTFLVALDTTIIGTAVPAITSEFHTLDDIAWYGSGYLLSLTALQPTIGKLYKVLNIKGTYLSCVLVFEVGSIMCAAAPSSPVFIAGRVIAGCGAAGLIQGALVIITNSVPLDKRPFYMSLIISAFGLCVGIGPVLGGTFSDKASWRWCFWINVPIGAVVVALIFVFLKLKDKDDVKDTAGTSCMQKMVKLDPLGTILVIASICSLLLAMQWGGQTLPWKSSKVIGLLVGAGVLFAHFLVLQWKMGDDATLPYPILKQRSIASGAFYLLFFSIPIYTYGYYIPIYFQSVKGFGALKSGVEFLSLALPQIGFTVISGALATKFGLYTPYLIAGTAVSVIGSGLITTLGLGTSLATWVGYFFIAAAGTGMSNNHAYTAAQAVLSEADIPIGNAILQFTFQLGGSLSLCIAQTIFLNRLFKELAEKVPQISANAVVAAGAYRDVFIFALVGGGLAFLCSFGFEHKNVKTVAEERKAIVQGPKEAIVGKDLPPAASSNAESK